MNEKTLRYIHYWRNSLVDGALSSGILPDKKDGIGSGGNEDKYWTVTKADWTEGCLHDKVAVQSIFARADIPTDLEFVSLLVYPTLYQTTSEHTVGHGGWVRRFSSISVNVLMNRNGNLFVEDPPLVPRDILDPVYPDKGIVVGEIQTLDEFLTKKPFDLEIASKSDREKWRSLLSYIEEIEKAVCTGIEPTNFKRLDDKVLVTVRDANIEAKSIISLYDDLRKNNPNSPFLDEMLSDKSQEILPAVSSEDFSLSHVGHMDPDNSLVCAQRDALAHFLSLGNRGILPINGPPGTGKTTLIQGIVATLWVKPLLGDDEFPSPPVIVAASTNNQAVTNVIESFGAVRTSESDPLKGRWLPESFNGSYGLYFSSETKKSNALLRGFNLPGSIEEMEKLEKVLEAERIFIERFMSAFGLRERMTIETSLPFIRKEIRSVYAEMATFRSLWETREQKRENLEKITGNDYQKFLREKTKEQTTILADLSATRKWLRAWISYLAAEPFWYGLLSFFPPVRKKRRYHILEFMESNGIPLDVMSAMNIDVIEHTLKVLCAKKEQEAKAAEAIVKNAKASISDFEAAETKWVSHCQKIFGEKSDSFQDANKKMDTTLRYRMFRLATHYWEGAWIMECKTTIHSGEQQLKDTKGVKKIQRKWRRRAKIFPCTVSTFHKLPDAFSGWEGETKYLYDFIDLLIVDEAGQVSPEIAGASLSLAKKTLVVGDVKQIEPVWSVPEIVDRGNMLKSGIVADSSEEEFERLSRTGRSSSSGSIMRMAHEVSPVHYDQDLEKGMYLYEHRRCADPIIQYCNRLCYGGKLVPKRGEIVNRILPYWGYAHVVGKSEKSGGSRSNVSEAMTIAAWIAENKVEMETHYKAPIHEIVGVVTPFSSQSRLVSSKISEKLGTAHKITVGTVHALQGAERRIVVFSSVYSSGDAGQYLFFDKSENMLNVAVSRAKDSFLVFGNMNIFDEQSAKPSGIMAKFLFENPENELSVIQPSLRDDLLSPGEGFKVLKTLEDHNEVLENILRTAEKEVFIVSPWIKTKAIAFVSNLLKDSIARGLSITVYTDKNFNEGENGKNRAEFLATREKLESLNVVVKVVERVHSKLLIKDSELMCIGSFNWLSAARHEDSARLETTILYRSPKVKDEIDDELNLLDTRIVAGEKPSR